MKSHVTEPLRPRREPVWVRATREPVPGDYATALFVLFGFVLLALAPLIFGIVGLTGFVLYGLAKALRP